MMGVVCQKKKESRHFCLGILTISMQQITQFFMNIKHVFNKFLIEYANFAFSFPIIDIEYAWTHYLSMILIFYSFIIFLPFSGPTFSFVLFISTIIV